MEALAGILWIPMVVLFCHAAVLAVRRDWRRSATSALGSVVCFLLLGLLLQAQGNAIRMALIQGQNWEIADLRREIEDLRKQIPSSKPGASDGQ